MVQVRLVFSRRRLCYIHLHGVGEHRRTAGRFWSKEEILHRQKGL